MTPRASTFDKPVAPITVFVCIILLGLLGWREPIHSNFTIGYAAAALLAPLWWSSVRMYSKARAIVFLSVLSLGMGIWLAEFASATRAVDSASYRGNGALLVGSVITVGVVLWARRIMPVWLIGLAYGAGMLLGVSPTGLAAENIWKFGLLLPAVIISLSLCTFRSRSIPVIIRISRRQRLLEFFAVGAAAVMSALYDARSFFAMLLLVLVLLAWQLIPSGRSGRIALVRTIVAFTGIVTLTFNIGVNLALDGFLGASAQERSEAQLTQSGSLILGGRPEIAASVALFLERPFGFGLGVTPSLTDIIVAKSGMAQINYEPNNGYVENYMFGSHFELHSLLGDLWVSFGIPGIFLSIMILALVVTRGLIAISARSASAFLLFLVVYTAWNIFFSPFYSAVTVVALAVGMVLSPRGAASRPITT